MLCQWDAGRVMSGLPSSGAGPNCEIDVTDPHQTHAPQQITRSPIFNAGERPTQSPGP